jgi:hypothetical protein
MRAAWLKELSVCVHSVLAESSADDAGHFPPDPPPRHQEFLKDLVEDHQAEYHDDAINHYHFQPPCS